MLKYGSFVKCSGGLRGHFCTTKARPFSKESVILHLTLISQRSVSHFVAADSILLYGDKHCCRLSNRLSIALRVESFGSHPINSFWKTKQ